MFNYEIFIDNLIKEAINFIPSNLQKSRANDIKDNIRYYTYIINRKLEKNEDFSENEKYLILQYVAEWVFRKSINLYNSKIKSDEHIYEILEIISYHIHDIAKQHLKKNDTKQFSELIEKEVENIYLKVLDKFYLSDDEKRSIIENSNIDICDKEVHSKKQKESLKILINLLFWLITFCIFFKTIIYFGSYFKHSIIFYVIAFSTCIIVWNKITNKIIDKELEKLKGLRHKFLDLVDPNSKFDILEIENEIQVTIGSDLVQIADVDLDINILCKIAALRIRLAKQLGYIIPKVRICDDPSFDKNRYEVSINNITIEYGYIYPNRYLINGNFENIDSILSSEKIENINPITKEKEIWIKKQDISKINKNIQFKNAIDTLISRLEKTFIENSDKILTIKDTFKYIDLVKQNYSEKLIDNLLAKVNEVEIKHILSYLIKQKVSIKNISYIFELIYIFASKNVLNNNIAEQIKLLMK